VPRDRFGVDVEGIFERAGLNPLVLTRAEASRADETPGIRWSKFYKEFGTPLNFELPQGSKVPGYEDFVCTGIASQPFMPLDPGKPGLLFRLPVVIETSENDREKSIFHVLSTTQPSGPLYYRGKYTKTILKIPFTWTNHGLPKSVRHK